MCHMCGRWEEALEHFASAAELDPENPGILCSRGDLLADMGQYGDALASYALAIELKPSFRPCVSQRCLAIGNLSRRTLP